MERYKERVRKNWNARSGLSAEATLQTWRLYSRGWLNYFKIAQSDLRGLSSWTRRHIRKWFWQRWHKRKGRLKRLRRLGLAPGQLRRVNFHLAAWPAAKQPGMHQALNNRRLRRWGLLTPNDSPAVI